MYFCKFVFTSKIKCFPAVFCHLDVRRRKFRIYRACLHVHFLNIIITYNIDLDWQGK